MSNFEELNTYRLGHIVRSKWTYGQHFASNVNGRSLGPIHKTKDVHTKSRKIDPCPPCPCGHTINFEKFEVFCTKKCGRPHRVFLLDGPLCHYVTIFVVIRYNCKLYLASNKNSDKFQRLNAFL